MSAWSGPTGSATNVPSANGTRTASPCPPSRVVPPHHPPCKQEVCRPCWQNSHVPSDQANGATTRSPFFTVRTSVPMDSTTPTNSWPMRFPVVLAGIELYGHTSQSLAWDSFYPRPDDGHRPHCSSVTYSIADAALSADHLLQVLGIARTL